MTLLRLIADVDCISGDGDQRSCAAVVDIDTSNRGRVRLDFGEIGARRGDAVVIEFDLVALAAAVAVAREKQDNA